MGKYIFQYEDNEIADEHARVITHEVLNVETWHDLLPHFMDFLKGTGFVFGKYASLEVVTEDQTQGKPKHNGW